MNGVPGRFSDEDDEEEDEDSGGGVVSFSFERGVGRVAGLKVPVVCIGTGEDGIGICLGLGEGEAFRGFISEGVIGRLYFPWTGLKLVEGIVIEWSYVRAYVGSSSRDQGVL